MSGQKANPKTDHDGDAGMGGHAANREVVEAVKKAGETVSPRTRRVVLIMRSGLARLTAGQLVRTPEPIAEALVAHGKARIATPEELAASSEVKSWRL